MSWGIRKKIGLAVLGLLVLAAIGITTWSISERKTKVENQPAETTNIIEQKIERGELSKQPARNYHKVQ